MHSPVVSPGTDNPDIVSLEFSSCNSTRVIYFKKLPQRFSLGYLIFRNVHQAIQDDILCNRESINFTSEGDNCPNEPTIVLQSESTIAHNKNPLYSSRNISYL